MRTGRAPSWKCRGGESPWKYKIDTLFISKDAHVIAPTFPSSGSVGFFGVYDGHGGSTASEYWYFVFLRFSP